MKFSVAGFLLLFIVVGSFFSCSTTKYVPDGEYLLDKIKIKTDNPEYDADDLRPYVRQLPNYKMFALNKTQLQLYSLSGRDTTKWINRELRKIGEAPVVFDSTLVLKTKKEFGKLLVNKGYIDADVSSEVNLRGKKADVVYQIRSNEPYRIREITADIQDTAISNTLSNVVLPSRIVGGESVSSILPLLKPGILFDRDLLDRDRERITSILRNRGYYAFTKDFITFNADTALMSHQVDMEMVIHPFQKDSVDVQRETPHIKYYMDEVKIYADYDPLKYGSINSYMTTDSIKRGKYTIFYTSKKSVRPSVLLDNCFIESGALYNERRTETTYSAFSGLNALSNVNIRFEEKERNDSTLLDCYILAMPSKKQSVSYAVEGTNSAGDLGFATSVTYQHRNLFKGSESLNVRLLGAYESISGNFSKNYWNLGGEMSVNIPKFIFPFLGNSFKRRMRASTEFSTSYNYQTRPEYDRIVLSGGIRYVWQRRLRRPARHQFNLLDVDYVYLPYINAEFEMNLPENARLFSYTNQFIVGMSYSYSYSTFIPGVFQRNLHSFRGSIESAGNVLYAISNLSNQQRGEKGAYALFNIYYAQFLKGDLDYSKTKFIDEKNSVAWHVGFGWAFPYGNSSLIPFEKRYYSGGSNSVRGWNVRTLGPGSYRYINNETTIYDQSGDIRLDLNIEYRSRLFWKLEMAAFVDGGNIWTIKNYERQEGGHFRFDSFYKEIAASYGLGLRLNFDYFLIRFDCGMKAYDPGRNGKDKWTVLHPNFNSNFAWHFAVGYPF